MRGTAKEVREQVQVVDLQDLQLSTLPFLHSFHLLFPQMRSLLVGQTGEGYSMGHRRSTPEKLSVPFSIVGSDLVRLSFALNLRMLTLSYCRLQVLPVQIGQIHTLETLHLAGNELSRLPLGMSRLSRLKQLELHGNELLPMQLAKDAYLPADTQSLLVEIELFYGRACQEAVITLLCIHRAGGLYHCGHDIAVLIAKMIWETRLEPCWRTADFHCHVEPFIIEEADVGVLQPLDEREFEHEAAGLAGGKEKCTIQ